MKKQVIDAVHTRISANWKNMDAQLYPSRYLLGDNLGVLICMSLSYRASVPGAGGFTKPRLKWRKWSVAWTAIRAWRRSGRDAFRSTRGGKGNLSHK
jgi:glutathione S-transferase